MNIYLIARGIPSNTDPQWGSFEFDQAKALATKGHKISMLSVDVRWKSRNRKLGIVKQEKGNIVSYDLYCGPWVILKVISNRLYEYITSTLLMSLFKYVVKKEGMPEVLYSHYLDSFLDALPIKTKFDIPLVGLEHWSELGKKQPSSIALRKAHKVYPKLDQLLVVSNALKENIENLIGVPSIVLPNVIGDDFIKSKDLLTQRDVVRFVSTGNLVGIKCMDMIIKAMKLIYAQGYKVDLTIVGDGPDRNMLETLVENFNLGTCVHLIGRKARLEIVNILNGSDVYIMASSSETFGVAAAEALACGVPVIATDCGGPRDFLTSSNGIIIPVNDVNKLADAMIYMIKHYKEYDRNEISKDFHKRFSAEAVANQLTDIFNKICKK